jgi:phage shock protein PspC (stress-responsive transcriptional regulator)
MDSNTDGGYETSPTATPDSRERPERPPLRRPFRGRMLAGVCAAIGRYFNIDVTIVRVVFAVLTIVGFTGLPFFGALPLYLGGIPLYLACWLLIPEEGSDHSIAANFIKNHQHKPERGD